MELRNFVKQSLLDIVGGVVEAQNEIKKGQVIPHITHDTPESIESSISSIQSVGFEVSVIADENQGSKANINVVPALIGGNVEGESTNSAHHVAILTFRVPVKFPTKIG